MIEHYINDSCTGEWLRLMAILEHEPEIPVTVDPDDGRYVVAGVVKVDSIEVALDLARVA